MKVIAFGGQLLRRLIAFGGQLLRRLLLLEVNS